MMRYLIASFLSVLLLSAAVRGQSTSSPATGDETATQLKQLESEWMRAVRERDQPGLERILAPEYSFTVALAGKPFSAMNRDAYIHRAKGYVIEESRFDENLIRVYGDVAVVTSRYVQKAALHGRDRSAEFLLTDTWVKRDGGWRAVARTSSRPEHPAVAP